MEHRLFMMFEHPYIVSELIGPEDEEANADYRDSEREEHTDNIERG